MSNFPPLSQRMELVTAHFGAWREGKGFKANCPCHDDGKASLAISEGDTSILLKCFAGCSFDSIAKTLPQDVRDALLGGQNSPKKPIKRIDRASATIAEIYLYVDERGNDVFEVLRYEPKDFRVRYKSGNDYIYKKPKNSNYLYNLPGVLDAIEQRETFYICEGEKDCKTLGSYGLVATTNATGAANFKPEVAIWLKDATSIVICEDNDKAGQDRTRKIVTEIRALNSLAQISVIRFADKTPHYDVADFFNDGGTLDGFLARIEPIGEDLPEDTTPRSATVKDYVALAEKRFGKIRRELLSNEIIVFDKGTPTPLLNREKVLRSLTRETRLTSHIKYKSNEVMDAIIDYADGQLPGELLLEIPTWDGIDRIADICSVLKFENVSSYCFEQIIKKWGADIFKRLENPDTQPITPIIMGPQGAGKDSLLRALCGGFGEGIGGYFASLKLSKNKIDDATKDLHSKLVWNIAEFDHTAKTEHAILKDLLTASSIRSRLSYDARPEDRHVRCSFIATCNVKSVFGDSTGSRRFVFFQLSYAGLKMRKGDNGLMQGVTPPVVEADYPGHWQRKDAKTERLQIVAQFKYLSSIDFKGEESAWEEMREQMDRLTPDDYRDAVIEDWIEEMKNDATYNNTTPSGIPCWTAKECESILLKLSKDHGFKSKRVVQGILKDRGFYYRNDLGRFYTKSLIVTEKEPQKMTQNDTFLATTNENDKFYAWED